MNKSDVFKAAHEIARNIKDNPQYQYGENNYAHFLSIGLKRAWAKFRQSTEKAADMWKQIRSLRNELRLSIDDLARYLEIKAKLAETTLNYNNFVNNQAA